MGAGMTLDSRWGIRFAAVAALLGLVLVLLAPSTLTAQTTSVIAKAGEPTIVAKELKAITPKDWPKSGSVVVLADPKDTAAPFKLRYTPDLTAQAGIDTLSYLVEGDAKEHVVAINITPANAGFDGQIYGESFKAIFLLFVLAVLLESALALVFNWRPFAENLVPRAVRPIIAFVVAFIFVRTFQLDIVTALVNAVGSLKSEPGLPGAILTAMIIAGGSSGVNNMLVALGFRQVRTPETVTPKPPPNKAFLAIRALPGKAVGDLYVYVGPTPTAGKPALLGVIKGRSVKNFFSWCLPDRGRLPNYGGHAVDINMNYTILVEGKDADGNPLSETQGPLQFAGGAFIDIDVRV